MREWLDVIQPKEKSRSLELRRLQSLGDWGLVYWAVSTAPAMQQLGMRGSIRPPLACAAWKWNHLT